jgi:hypothetical protein
MSFSMALTGFGFADCRKALNSVPVSMERFIANQICQAAITV